MQRLPIDVSMYLADFTVGSFGSNGLKSLGINFQAGLLVSSSDVISGLVISRLACESGSEIKDSLVLTVYLFYLHRILHWGCGVVLEGIKALKDLIGRGKMKVNQS